MKKIFLIAATFSFAATVVITGCGRTANVAAVTNAELTTSLSAEAASTDAAGDTGEVRELKNDVYKPDVKVAPKAAKVKILEDNVTSGYGFERGNLGDVTLVKGDTFARVKIKNYGTIDFKLYKELTPDAY